MKKWNIGWGTVSRCNMKCKFCYSQQNRSTCIDLKFSDWIKFVDENSSKIGTINYGTGENTLSDDWFRLVEYIHMHYPDIRQALTTNGYLSEAVKKEKHLRIFQDAIDEIDISLDFFDAHKHNELRGQPEAWKWAVNTLKLCYEHHKPATIVFLGSQQNLTNENIRGLFQIAEQYQAILRMNMYRPTLGINELSKKFIAPYTDIIKSLEYISEHYSVLSLNDALFSTIFTNHTVSDPSGDKSIRILADGSITPSTYLIKEDYIVANIKESNVLEKLEQSHVLEQIVNMVIPEECSQCIYKNKCQGGVYDRRYLWFGTLDRKDPYCPGIFTEENHKKFRLSGQAFSSVHDGYLPTMFFAPKRGEGNA